MKHAELFAGYGGLGLAVEESFGAELAWYAEFDAAPSKIMARHWPGVPNYGDVTAVDWSAVEPVDIISGGSPCQDVSAAGRRAGMTDDTRSNLWVAMREAIANIKPTYVVWENVRGAHSAAAYSAVESEPGLLGEPGGAYLRATGRVVGDLASLGYDAQWRTISAASVGAPHRRERVFVLAWRRGAATEDGDGRRDGRGDAPSGGGRRAGADAPAVLPAGASGGTGSATEVALLPTPQANLASNGGSQHPDKRRAGGHSVSIADVAEHTADFGPYAPAIRRWEQALGRPAPPPTELSPRGKHRLSERFTEWMMGLPAGWICDTPGVSRNEAIKAAGNGVVPQQAAFALRQMNKHLPAPLRRGFSMP